MSAALYFGMGPADATAMERDAGDEEMKFENKLFLVYIWFNRLTWSRMHKLYPEGVQIFPILASLARGGYNRVSPVQICTQICSC